MIWHVRCFVMYLISAILQTVKEEQSDTASTCSDTMEDQQQLDFPVQSGLSSFLASFGADVKKHLNVRYTFLV